MNSYQEVPDIITVAMLTELVLSRMMPDMLKPHDVFLLSGVISLLNDRRQELEAAHVAMFERTLNEGLFNLAEVLDDSVLRGKGAEA